MSSSDVENDDCINDVRMNFNNHVAANDKEDLPSVPPRNKLDRRYTHDTIESDDIKLENIDPALLEEDEEPRYDTFPVAPNDEEPRYDTFMITPKVEDNEEKSNFNTFLLPKAKKGIKPPNQSINVNKSSPVNKVSASGDSSPKPPKPITNCSIEAEKEMESLLRSENVNLHKKLETNSQLLEDMRRCVVEYESTIKDLNEANEKKISEKISVINNLNCERDQAVQDLNTIEKAFSDLQRRFEKSKDIIDNLHKNESVLKKHSDDLKEELSKSETKYNNLKIMTERRLRKAAEEVDAARRQNESEIARLQAIAKKAELKISTLEKQLSQKVEETVELNKICEELISKYSLDS